MNRLAILGGVVAIALLGSVANISASAPQADLHMLILAPLSVNAGDSLTITPTVGSAPGFDTARNVVVINSLPAGVTFESVNPQSGTCALVANNVVCKIGNIPSGEGRAIDITLKVDPSASGTLSFTSAAISTTSDPDLSNNSAAVSVAVEN